MWSSTAARGLASAWQPTALGCLAYAAGHEVQAYRLRRVDVPVLPAGQRPLRVLHVSDLHMLTTDDLAQIETAAAQIKIPGSPLPEHLERLIDR